MQGRRKRLDLILEELRTHLPYTLMGVGIAIVFLQRLWRGTYAVLFFGLVFFGVVGLGFVGLAVLMGLVTVAAFVCVIIALYGPIQPFRRCENRRDPPPHQFDARYHG